MPAAWYTVHLDSAPQGTLGESAASITSGSLTVDSSYDPDNDGTALIYADSATDAIQTALTGGVVVNLTAVNLPPATYEFTEGTSSGSTGDQTPFAVTPTTTSTTWKVWLEDLTADPAVSDWDYNDFYWTVTATEVNWPTDTLALVGVHVVEPSVTEVPGTPTTLHFTVSATGPSGPVGQSITVAYSAYLLDTGEPVQSGTVTIPAGQSEAVLTLSVPAATDPTAIRQFGVVLDDLQAAGIRVAPDASQASVFVSSPLPPPTVSVMVAEQEVFADDPTEALTVDTALARTDSAALPSLADVRYEVTVFEGPNTDIPVSQEILTATFGAGEAYAPITLNLGASQTAGTSARKVRLRVLPPSGASSSPPYTPNAYTSVSWTVVRQHPGLTPPAPEDLEWNDVIGAADTAGVSGALSTWSATVTAGVSVALDAVMKTVIAGKAKSDWTVARGTGHPTLAGVNPDREVSTTRNRKLRLPDVTIVLPVAEFVPPKDQIQDTIRIRGKTRAPAGGAVDPGLKFGWDGELKPTVTVSTQNGQQKLTAKDVLSDAALSAVVNEYQFDIDWEISWAGKDGPWFKVDKPDRPLVPRTVYTTYATPSFGAAADASKLTVPKTLIVSGTRALAGTTPANDAAVMNGVFSLFQAKTFTDAEGKKPGYYTTWNGTLRELGGANLVANTPGAKDGHCPDWANVLVLLLEGQGLNMTAAARGSARFELPGGAGRAKEYFLVAGQWEFKADAKLNTSIRPQRGDPLYSWATIATPAPGPGGVPPSWKNFLGTAANVAQRDFPEQPVLDGLEGRDRGVKFVKLTTGNLGQNTTNPYPAFDNHVVVIFDGKIYDPSYGTSFTAGANLAANQLAFEKASIAGFVRLAHAIATHAQIAGVGPALGGNNQKYVYLYRQHSGKLELGMVKLPSPTPTASPR